MPLNKPSLILTDDGSMTCFNEETGELYHNRAGAYTEALVNYVKPSHFLDKLSQTQSLQLLDVCFGLGYNSWVFLEALLKNLPQHPFTITIHGIEKDPKILQMIPEVLKDPKLCYLKKFPALLEHNIYYQTQTKVREITINVGENQVIILKLTLDDLRQVVPILDTPFDLIFHDPFSPVKVPHLWTVDLFNVYFNLLKVRQGRLLTYSTAGAVRGGLREAGFFLYRTAALGKKTGGTLASTQKLVLPSLDSGHESYFVPISSEEETYLNTRSSLPYRDATFKSHPEQIVVNRMEELQQSERPQAKRKHRLVSSND